MGSAVGIIDNENSVIEGRNICRSRCTRSLLVSISHGICDSGCSRA
eukprot:XP_001708079.1 Hypothetical protein GL50803_38286 [Giardia lamblia ATCC 50803]